MSEPKELQELRQERGLSVEKLAEQSGVEAEIIRAIERGRWYQENDGFFAPEEEREILWRLMETLGAEETGILMDTPPSLRPGDIVLGAEASELIPKEVIEANADKVSIAVPDPETGEVGLIWYESLTLEDIDRILEDKKGDKRWLKRRARGYSITSHGCRRWVCNPASLGSTTKRRVKRKTDSLAELLLTSQ